MALMSGCLQMKFWGVRGSIPTPQTENLGFGGNTPCMEIRYPGLPPLIFDGGSGLRRLGLSLLNEFPSGGECRVFLTHFHWDHIQGVPFFIPMYRPDWSIHFHSGCESGELQKLLGDQMRPPYFPVEMPAVQAVRSYSHVPASGLGVAPICIRPIPLNHPNGANGYRIDAGGRSIVFATDHEHGNSAFDRGLAERAAGADILIYDAQYTPEEYESRRGWGHSTWQHGVRIAREAGVGQLILFHHDPQHDDAAVACIVEQARAVFPNTMGATEGWSAVFE
jgi:phosphoribosyl 1,2-cyclic phosphodiesterase